MIDETGAPILVDFGKAKQLNCEEDDITTSLEGTYMFLPPESCSFDADSYSLKKADIWSLGIVIYCLSYNKLPFPSGQTEIELMQNICEKPISFESRKISPELRELLESILEKNPEKRASLE